MFKTALYFAALTVAFPFAAYSLDRISITASGPQGNGDSWPGTLSDDGDTIAFSSHSTVLTAGDTNTAEDVFVYQLSTNTMTLVSRSTSGGVANNGSNNAKISGDGRYVVFESLATDLVAGFVDSNGAQKNDVFRHDLVTGTTALVSLADDESPSLQECTAPAVSGDGRHIAFAAGAGMALGNNFDFPRQVYVRDMTNGTTTRVSVDVNGVAATAECGRPDISSDGNLVIFDTQSDLLGGGDTNTKNMAAVIDVYLRDISGGTTERISIASGGLQGDDKSWIASISGDGNLVAFTSLATTFDTNGAIANRSKIFLRDRENGTTTRISESVSGTDPDQNSDFPSFSSNGRYLVFQSGAADLLDPGIDTNAEFDIYHYDLDNPGLTRVSVSDFGVEGSAGSYGGTVSDTGIVTFGTRSTEFDPADTGSFNDVYATIDRPNPPTASTNTALKRILQAKITKLKKQIKTLKRKGDKAKLRKATANLKMLIKRLKAL